MGKKIMCSETDIGISVLSRNSLTSHEGVWPELYRSRQLDQDKYLAFYKKLDMTEEYPK